jgi:predicted ATPase
LRHLLADAQRAGTGTLITLSRLSLPDVMELVDSATRAGLQLPPELGERLYRETEGLPFFLVEYLATLATDGDLSSNGDWPIPGGVRDLLHFRLDSVSEIGWQLLTTAAVIGRSFDFHTLRAASGRGEDETVIGLEELIARGLIEEVRGGPREYLAGTLPDLIYDFDHEKLRSLVYDETSLARRRLLHHRVAEALANRGRAGALAGQIANHYRLAGHELEAAEYFRLAGEHARALYAHAEALVHFRASLALGHRDAAALHEAIGDLHTLMGEYNAALMSYETAAALCAPDALASLEHKLGDVHDRRGEWQLAESHFQAALHALGEGDTAASARMYADWSLSAHHQGQTDRALSLARRALDLAETAQDTRALAQVHNILGILAGNRGEFDQARDHLEHSLVLAGALSDPAARVAALNNLALVCSASGELDRAFELTETALALCISQGDRHRQAALHSNLADLFHATGRIEAAMSHLKQAVAIFAEIGEEAGAWQPEIWKLVEW